MFHDGECTRPVDSANVDRMAGSTLECFFSVEFLVVLARSGTQHAPRVSLRGAVHAAEHSLCGRRRMSKKRKNAGEGYGYMFSGAFKKKADAVAKEKSRKGSFVKGVYTPQGHRYVVMTPRTNPRKKKAKPQENPTELMVMAANPHERGREIVVPPGTTITIRTNPATVNPDRYTSAHARAAGITRDRGGLIETPFQRRVAKMLRKASGSEAAVVARSYKKHRTSSRPSRGASKVFHEIFSPNPAICGHIIGGEPCTRKPGHRGPHLPQGATMRPKSRLRRH
jgi:hypothetical protein